MSELSSLQEKETRVRTIHVSVCMALALATIVQAQSGISTPSSHFGFELAADGTFAMWDQEVAYYEKLAKESDRIDLQVLGKSTLGRPFIMLTISSPQNLAKGDRYKAISRQMADPRGLTPQQIDALSAEGRAVVLVTLGQHSTEVASSQMGPRLVHRLATGNDERIRTILDNTIFLLIPSFNPDGHDIVGDWLKKSAGTPYEGAGPPELYGAYIGHDNNRDGYMLSQVESQHWAKVVYQDWFPQVFKDTHQMGSYGSRLAIPPKYDPINPHVDPLMWRTSQLLGGAMGTALEAEGVTGVESQVHYDAWFMASFHGVANLSNVTSFHTESASARLIWPLYIHPQQIQPGSRGRPENKAQMTFPHPWPGGWWRMSDIARQQEIETIALVETMGRYRQSFLKNRALAAMRQVERGAAEGGHVIPMSQHDPGTALKFASTLMMNGVEVHRASERFTSGSRIVEAGDLIVKLDQPSRAFIKTMIEPAVYPDNEWTRRRDGNPLPPYDMASFTLADHMGVETFPLHLDFLGAEASAKAASRVTPRLEKLTTAPKLAGRITGTGSAGWLLTPTWNHSFRAVNRVLKNGGAVYRLPSPPAPWAPGTFWIPAGGAINAAALEALATEFGVPFTAAAAAPSGSMSQLKPLRVALYRRYAGGNMDEGWTRFLFDQWEFPYTRVDADEIKKGGLNAKYDAVLIADDTVRAIVGAGGAEAQPTPFSAAALPAEYTRALGNAGVDALKEFVRAGGSLVLLDNATTLATERFGVPVRNPIAGLSEKEFFAPGSSLRVHVDPTQPLGYGMPKEATVVFYESTAFDINNSSANDRISVVARYHDRDLLRGGWLDGEKHLAGMPALLDVGYGKGRIAMIGFRAQNRAQAYGTFKVLFNALYEAGASKVESRK
jgi:Zinc carboxypeptidase